MTLRADLREQVADVIAAAQLGWHTDDSKPADGEGLPEELADAVLVVFAERERLLRERIEALPEYVFAEPFGVRLDKADVLGVFDDES